MTVKGFLKGLLKGLAVTVVLVVGFGLWLFNCVGSSVEPRGRHAALLADPMANVDQLSGVTFERRFSDGDGEVLGKPSFAVVSSVFGSADEASVRRAADEALALAEEAGWVLREDGVSEDGYVLVKQIDSQEAVLHIFFSESILMDEPEEWDLHVFLRYPGPPPS